MTYGTVTSISAIVVCYMLHVVAAIIYHWVIAFAFLNKSFATVPYFLIYTFEQQRFVFCNKRLQKMACSLNETRDELNIPI